MQNTLDLFIQRPLLFHQKTLRPDFRSSPWWAPPPRRRRGATEPTRICTRSTREEKANQKRNKVWSIWAILAGVYCIVLHLCRRPSLFAERTFLRNSSPANTKFTRIGLVMHEYCPSLSTFFFYFTVCG